MKTFTLLLLCMFAFPVCATAQMAEIIAPDATTTKLAGDMKFTEGPVWIPARKALVWSDIPNSRQMQWSAADGPSEYRKVEQSNGNLLDLKGNLLSCQHFGRNLIRTEADGSITVLADRFNGKRFNSPNDLAIRADGVIFFTDPSYGLKGREAEIDGKWVYQLDPDGTVTVICKDFDMPNGIAFSPDEKTVYIADTGKLGKVQAYAVPADGGMLGKPLFIMDCRCDGMCVDVKGNLYFTAKGGIHVYSGAGEKVGLIPTPEHPANVCFGGEDYKTLYITARKSLYSVPVKNAGAKPTTARW